MPSRCWSSTADCIAPVCSGYLKDLDRKLDQFADKGVNVLALSCDGKERAEQSRDEWKIPHLNIGYGLAVDKAREWGLYISRAIADKETAEFSEPGLFLVKPDGNLYYSANNSMPFGRPKFDEMLKTLDFVLEKDYPARGEA